MLSPPQLLPDPTYSLLSQLHVLTQKKKKNKRKKETKQKHEISPPTTTKAKQAEKRPIEQKKKSNEICSPKNTIKFILC